MRRSVWNWNLIAQWAAVGVLSALFLAFFVIACRWHGGDEFVIEEMVKHFLGALLGIAFIGGVCAIAISIESRAKLKNKLEKTVNPVLIISYDLPQARKGLKEQVINWTAVLPLFLFLVMIAFWKYGDAPWWAAAVIAGAVEILGLCQSILIWVVSRRYAGCRWLVEHDGVRYESPHSAPVVIKWAEVEKIKQQPLTLGQGDKDFSLPSIPGLMKDLSEGNRFIRDRLRHRFELGDAEWQWKNPLKLFIRFFLLTISLLVIWLGWMVYGIQGDYSLGYIFAPLIIFVAPFILYAAFQQSRWRAPVDK